MGEDNYNFIPTRCSTLKNSAVPYQEVVYVDPSKRKRNEPRSKSTFSAEGDTSFVKNQELDMKRARFEIFKFAKKNAKNISKKQTDIELAIKLGARGLRNKKYTNYKEMLAKKQKKKIKKERNSELKKINEKFNGKSLKKKRKFKKRKKRDVLDAYGQVSLI